MFRKKNTLTFHQKKTIFTPKLFREIFSWISVTIIAIVLALAFVLSFGMQVKVIGDSMETTVYNGQTVLVNKLTLRLFGPKKGEIIAFLPNGNENSHYYVKRVVAVPGERVQIIDGALYINGTLQEKDEEEYDKMEDAGIAANEIKLKSGEYFVLGDSRNQSEDSRSANIGIVKTSMMVGKVWFKIGDKEHKGGFLLN